VIKKSIKLHLFHLPCAVMLLLVLFSVALCTRLPPRLKRGDTVAFVSPCSPPCDLVTTNCPDGFKSDVEQQMASLGLSVVWGKYAFEKDQYLAGNDYDRAADLTQVFLDPSVRCFLCQFFVISCFVLLQ
jgi:hypothetical protein